MFETNYVTRVGKILSRQRTPDRYTLVSIFKPKEKEQKDHGVLYFIIEILSPDPAMKRVAQLIEDTVIEEYYQDLSDGLDSLETSLKKVNEALADLADEGEVGWVGRINGVIAALEGNVLHITQTGTTEAYLVRENKITHVTENLSSAAEKPNPLKTFINIASGELNIGDKVIISTSELFYHFSLDDLRRITSRFSPATSAAYVVKALRKEEIESINTLVLELTTEEEALAHEEAEVKEEGIIAEPSGALQQYATLLRPFWKRFLFASTKGLEKSREIYKGKISPQLTKFGQEASKKVSEKITEISKGETKELDFFAKAKEGKEKKEKGPQQELFKAPRKNLFTIAFTTIRISYSKTKDFVGKSQERSQFFMTAAILLAVLLVVSGIYSYQRKKIYNQRVKIESTYEAIKTKTEGAIKARQYGDEKKSRDLLAQAKEEITAITSSSYLHQEIGELNKQIEAAIEDIFNVQRINEPTLVVNFNELDGTIKLDGLFGAGNKIFAFDRERHQAVSYSLETQKAEMLSSVSYDGRVEDLVPSSDKNVFDILTSDPPGIYIYNTAVGTIAKGNLLAGGAWPEAKSIETYFNNIYLLVPSDNQIYKYASAGVGYGNKISYINDSSSVDIKDGVDIAIDGSIYVLLNNGKVVQFLGGNKVDFSLSGMPLQEFDKTKGSKEGSLLSPTKIITTNQMNEIYILDPGAKRLVVFDKLGNYKTQYISDKFTDLRDFGVDLISKKIYVLSGTEVFEINI